MELSHLTFMKILTIESIKSVSTRVRNFMDCTRTCFKRFNAKVLEIQTNFYFHFCKIHHVFVSRFYVQIYCKFFFSKTFKLVFIRADPRRAPCPSGDFTMLWNSKYSSGKGTLNYFCRLSIQIMILNVIHALTIFLSLHIIAIFFSKTLL